MPVPLKSCCFVLSLQQGAKLIALIELLLSAIVLFLLLLGSAHAQEMAAMLEADIEETKEWEDPSAELVYSRAAHYSNNEMRLHRAQHLALVMIIALYTGIALVTIHLISCVLLLYGAAMQIRQFLLPWMSVVLIGLAFGLTALLLAMFFGRGSTSALLVLSVVMQIRLCLWMVVFSFYRQLYESQSTTCAMMVQQDMNAIKAGYLTYPQYYKPSDV